MGMTITGKIIAAHSNRKNVSPGEFLMAKVDMVLANDITAPLAVKEFYATKRKKIFNRNKIVFVLDHHVPNKDINSAENCRLIREFARKFKIANPFEGSNGGIEHALLPEKGLVNSGDLIIGADSHTCTYGALGAFATGVGSTDIAGILLTGEIWLKVPETMQVIFNGKKRRWVYGKDLILKIIGDIGVDGAHYKTIDFSGETIENLSMPERFTICNMVIEAGAKNGIIAADEITRTYLKKVCRRTPIYYKDDPDAHFCRVLEYDVSKIEPLVALPHSPQNIKSVYELNRIHIDQVVIGSCTNGWLEDLRIVAKILKGKKVNKNVRLLIFPATYQIYKKALSEGLIQIFIDAGAVVCPPTCGPCLGGHLGILAKGERAVSTTNRNFIGRMGHPESEVYLSNPAIAASSAILGWIGPPEEIGLK
ncbi:MAG: 3-isopropylmalate dehydratase large subunit [candidate division WOR-3 bacterium]